MSVYLPANQRDPRRIFRLFAEHWHCLLGTPSRQWLEYTLYNTLSVDIELNSRSADRIYDQIYDTISQADFRPRALFDSFNIELLATTDSATDTLEHHDTIKYSAWSGRIIPTFRPDSVLNPARFIFCDAIKTLETLAQTDVESYSGYLDALRHRRMYFKQKGAKATDHDVPSLTTDWLDRTEVETLYHKAINQTISTNDAHRFYGHMLVEMALISIDDELVMQLHVGSARDTNREILDTYGDSMGADIPVAVNWVRGLDGLLNKVGNDSRLLVVLFTLDESTYARELAPLAGHWPCLRIGPPWWFHDSTNGVQRYFYHVVETAGYFNLSGFNDDTRAFLSIPARHDMWRRGVATHLSEQVAKGRFGATDAHMLASALCRGLALAWTIRETPDSFTAPFFCSEFCEGANVARRNTDCISD